MGQPVLKVRNESVRKNLGKNIAIAGRAASHKERKRGDGQHTTFLLREAGCLRLSLGLGAAGDGYVESWLKVDTRYFFCCWLVVGFARDQRVALGRTIWNVLRCYFVNLSWRFHL